MKKILFAVLVFAVSASAQNPFGTDETVTWYNESGGRVTAIANGDTLVSEIYDLALYDEVALAFAGTSGDTVHANVGYQLGAGGTGDTTNSFFKGGFKAFVITDSLANNGARNGGVALAAVMTDVLMSTTDLSVAVTDTTNFAYGRALANQKIGASKVRFVLVGYVGQDVTNTNTLAKTKVYFRRKQQ